MNEIKKHRTEAEHAPRFAKWFAERGGIAIWKTLDPENAGQTYTTPIKGPNGEPIESLRPHWSAEGKPSRIITDPSEVVVDKAVEFKRFHVGIRKKANGWRLKLNPASARRLNKYKDQAREKSNPIEAGSFHLFDYEKQDCIVYYIDGEISLTEWIERNPCPKESGLPPPAEAKRPQVPSKPRAASKRTTKGKP